MQLQSLGPSVGAAVSPTSTLANMSNPTCCHASAHFQEILSLSELPLDRLLRVKSVMHNYGSENNDFAHNRQGEPLPAAEALRSRVRFPDRDRGSSSGSTPIKRQEFSLLGSNGKQSKLATGFQLAITVLSFLAFGAYLISLVVAIVRNNSATTTTATTQQPFVLVPAASGRRRKRRKRRQAAPEPRPLPLVEPDTLFTGLATLAAAYAKFEGHQLG
ncbi:Hypothetical predicted protein [Cloeon dipterum]|uniref:Uncharacterized protein n=1 Tax=Cloeon dipterum TaxID=197152 RepID=A0A8S1CLC8_9INSE|nr:Hypothetical predicted protein [Cloeon dipterum]